ncbi:MAG: hypothetical protein AB3N16_08815 [Flavobacteriaceae bacterium]
MSILFKIILSILVAHYQGNYEENDTCVEKEVPVLQVTPNGQAPLPTGMTQYPIPQRLNIPPMAQPGKTVKNQIRLES